MKLCCSGDRGLTNQVGHGKLWVLSHWEASPKWMAKIDHSTSAGDFWHFTILLSGTNPNWEHSIRKMDSLSYQHASFSGNPVWHKGERGQWDKGRKIYGDMICSDCNIGIFFVVVYRSPRVKSAFHPILIRIITHLPASVDLLWILSTSTF